MKLDKPLNGISINIYLYAQIHTILTDNFYFFLWKQWQRMGSPRVFFGNILPKGRPKARKDAIGLCQKFDKAVVIFEHSGGPPLT